MNLLMIFDDAPDGTERTSNGLRLALNLHSKVGGTRVTVFLMDDAVGSAKTEQKTVLGLGGGIGGIAATNRLRKRPGRQHRVILVDREPTFALAPLSSG